VELCSSGHDEVCFDGRSCPVCDVLADLLNAEEDIEILKADIRELENASD